MTTSSTPRIYSARSSARRAAKAALGDGAFRIVELPAGGFAFEAIADDLPAPRVEPQTTPAIDDHPPGFKRLRAAAGAESIRAAVVADQLAGRQEAAARIAAAAAEPVELPTFLKPHSAASVPGAADAAPAAPKAASAARTAATGPSAREARTVPKEGTKTRLIFDMLCRPEGATAREIAAAGVAGVSVKAYAVDFAKSFGLAMACEKEGAVDRCRLDRPENIGV